MTNEPHPMSLQETLDRMEPGLSVPDITQSLASIAISLKRIADCVEDGERLSSQQQWAMREVGNSIANTIAGAIYSAYDRRG